MERKREGKGRKKGRGAKEKRKETEGKGRGPRGGGGRVLLETFPKPWAQGHLFVAHRPIGLNRQNQLHQLEFH